MLRPLEELIELHRAALGSPGWRPTPLAEGMRELPRGVFAASASVMPWNFSVKAAGFRILKWTVRRVPLRRAIAGGRSTAIGLNPFRQVLLGIEDALTALDKNGATTAQAELLQCRFGNAKTLCGVSGL